MIPETDFNRFKSLEKVKCFRRIRDMKEKREEKAKNILLEHMGKFEDNKAKDRYLREIFNLVDYPYPYTYKGETSRGPWFGHLIKPNAQTVFHEDYEKVNRWFEVLSNRDTSATYKLDRLRAEPDRLKGLSVGFITLMIYLLDKENYLIWFEGQHEGLGKLYPKFETYTEKSSQYLRFNDKAKKFADQYGFKHTEMDWVLTANLTEFIEPITCL